VVAEVAEEVDGEGVEDDMEVVGDSTTVLALDHKPPRHKGGSRKNPNVISTTDQDFL